MKTPTEIRELIAANRWRPIEEAPRDEPILINYKVDDWANIDITCWSERFECWQLEFRNLYATIEYLGWKPVPTTDELADVCQQLLEENERLRQKTLQDAITAIEKLDSKDVPDRFHHGVRCALQALHVLMDGENSC